MKRISKERKSNRLRSSKERNSCNCNFSTSVKDWLCVERVHFSTTVEKYIYIYIVEKVSFNLAGVHSIKRTGRRGKIANVLANKSNSAKE